MAAKPWRKYRRKHGKLLEPGWIGSVTVEEMELIHTKLATDNELAICWGFSKETITETSIRAVAMAGDPDDQDHNSRLVREVHGSLHQENSGSYQLSFIEMPGGF